MTLNKIRFLDEEQLLKAITDSGHEEIATILIDKGLNGRSFLEFQEIQTIGWKIPRIQVRKLTNFISQVKLNPSILITGVNSVKHPIYKPKPNIPSTPKPKIPLSIKHKLTTLNNDNPTLPESPTSTERHQTEFKKNSDVVIDNSTTPSNSYLPETKIKLPKPLPNQKQMVDVATKPSKIMPRTSKHSSVVKPKETNRLSPTNVNDTKNDSKLSKTVKLEPSLIMCTSVKERPACPLPKEIKDEQKMKEIKDETDLPEDYLSPNDIDNYPVRAISKLSKPAILTKRTNFNHSKAAHTLPIDDDEEQMEDTYEEPPTIHSPPKSKRTILPLENRKPMPLPSDRIERSYLSMNQNEIEDEEEINIYDDVDEHQQNINNKKGQNVNPKKNADQDLALNIQKSFVPTQKRKSTTIGELENIVIVERENQTWRTNNFLGSLGGIAKLFGTKSKPVKMESKKPCNYENHSLKNEVLAIQSPLLSFNDRPLPQIPQNDPFVSKSKPKETNSSSMRRKALQSKKSASHNTPKTIITSNSFKEPERKNELFSKTLNKSTKSLPPPEIQDDDVDNLVYGNIQDNKNDEDESDLPEYENNRNSSSNSQSTIHPLLPGDLAIKLSEALQIREKDLQDKQSDSQSPSRKLSGNQNFNNTQTSSPHDLEQDQSVYGNVEEENASALNIEVDLPLYRNLDDENDHTNTDEEKEEYIDSIFNINTEPFYRNTDRRGAKQLLRNFSDGAFLFRPSSNFFLVLSVKYSERMYNLGIERRPNNKIRLNADSSSVSPEFGTLRSFVNFFTKEPLTFRDRDGVLQIYLNPVLPADVF